MENKEQFEHIMNASVALMGIDLAFNHMNFSLLSKSFTFKRKGRFKSKSTHIKVKESFHLFCKRKREKRAKAK